VGERLFGGMAIGYVILYYQEKLRMFKCLKSITKRREHEHRASCSYEGSYASHASL